MTTDVKPRIRIPSQIKMGEVIEVKTLVTHEMESGQRRDAAGKLVPRKIIRRLTCAYNGRQIFAMDIEPAIAANPYISFFVKAVENGMLFFFNPPPATEIYTARQAIRLG